MVTTREQPSTRENCPATRLVVVDRWARPRDTHSVDTEASSGQHRAGDPLKYHQRESQVASFPITVKTLIRTRVKPNHIYSLPTHVGSSGRPLSERCSQTVGGLETLPLTAQRNQSDVGLSQNDKTRVVNPCKRNPAASLHAESGIRRRFAR